MIAVNRKDRHFDVAQTSQVVSVVKPVSFKFNLPVPKYILVQDVGCSVIRVRAWTMFMKQVAAEQNKVDLARICSNQTLFECFK